MPISPRSVTISVLTPNYNHGMFLAECIESVWSQEVQPVEHVIVDDGSTDDSVRIVSEYARKYPGIRLVSRPERRGVLQNVKEFLPQLRGSHCVNLAADDSLKPGYLNAATEVLTRYPQSGMCLAQFVSQDDDGRVSLHRYRLPDRPLHVPPNEAAAALRNSWPHGQAVVRSDALLAAGGLDDRLRWHSDWFAYWVVCLRHGFCYVPIVGSMLRVTSGGYSRGRTQSERAEVARAIVDLLGSPEYRDLRAGFRAGNSLSHLGWVGLVQVLRSEQKKQLLTLDLPLSVIRQNIWRLACRFTPRQVKDSIKQRLATARRSPNRANS